MSQILPLFGTGTLGKSSNVTAQKRINLYAEQFGDSDKTSVAYYARPGLVSIPIEIGGDTSESNGPFRGMLAPPVAVTGGSGHVTYHEYLFYVQGTHLRVLTFLGLSVRLDFSSGLIVDVPVSGSGPVSLADNGTQILMVNGVEGYLVDYDADNNFAGTLLSSQPASEDFPEGASSVCFIASRFVVNDPANPGRFQWSAALDGATWDALDYATAEGSPDPLLALHECRGELVLFGTESIEFWQPTTDTDIFARVGGSGIGWGLAAVASVAKWNDGMIFLGRNSLGNRQVCLMKGYQVQVISTPDIEHNINNDAAPDGATGVAFTIAGHSFYVLNLFGSSWAFDLTSGVWSEWQTEGGRWAGNFGEAKDGRFLVSDYRDGRLYYMDPETFTDDGELMLREIVTKHASANLDRITIDQVVLECEAGVGLISGQGSDPQMMLQISKDGGHTFGYEMWVTLGAMGQYLTRAVWNRLGRARDWVFRFQITDPVKVVILNIAARLRG